MNKKGIEWWGYLLMIVLGIIGIILIVFIFTGGFRQLGDISVGLLNQTPPV